MTEPLPAHVVPFGEGRMGCTVLPDLPTAPKLLAELVVEPLPVHLVDISHHQDGVLDLAGAKARGLKGLIHKATEGNSFVDAMYERRRAECAKVGLTFGAYHFARAQVGDAVAEAQHFLAVAQPKLGDMIALDLETTEGLSLADLRSWAKTFIVAIEKAIGVKLLVYTPFDLGGADDGCVIWRPRYNDTNTPPELPFDIWQFSNGVFGVPNVLEGIGHVDLNFMRAGLTMADITIPQEEDVTPEELRTELAAFKKSLLADLGKGLIAWPFAGDSAPIALDQLAESLINRTKPLDLDALASKTAAKVNVTPIDEATLEAAILAVAKALAAKASA